MFDFANLTRLPDIKYISYPELYVQAEKYPSLLACQNAAAQARRLRSKKSKEPITVAVGFQPDVCVGKALYPFGAQIWPEFGFGHTLRSAKFRIRPERIIHRYICVYIYVHYILPICMSPIAHLVYIYIGYTSAHPYRIHTSGQSPKV